MVGRAFGVQTGDGMGMDAVEWHLRDICEMQSRGSGLRLTEVGV